MVTNWLRTPTNQGYDAVRCVREFTDFAEGLDFLYHIKDKKACPSQCKFLQASSYTQSFNRYQISIADNTLCQIYYKVFKTVIIYNNGF